MPGRWKSKQTDLISSPKSLNPKNLRTAKLEYHFYQRPSYYPSVFVDLTYLLHELNAGLEIHTEIHEDPVDTFLLVLFLLKNEHVMVEKLLQLLVGEVDAKLLESVELH